MDVYVKVTKDTHHNGKGYLTVGKIYKSENYNKIDSEFAGFYCDYGDYIYENLTNPNHGYEYEVIKQEEPKVVDIYNIKKPWGELSPEEKGALLLHHHEGGKVEVFDPDLGDYKFNNLTNPRFDSCAIIYRAKKPEPVVETEEFYASSPSWIWSEKPVSADTHKITFKTIDGEPDVTSIKMEKL